MITEDPISVHPEKQSTPEVISTKNITPKPTQVLEENTVDLSEAEVATEKPGITAEITSSETEAPSEKLEAVELQEQPEHQADDDTQKSVEIPAEKVLSEIDPTKAEYGEPNGEAHHDLELEDTTNLTLPEIL